MKVLTRSQVDEDHWHDEGHLILDCKRCWTTLRFNEDEGYAHGLKVTCPKCNYTNQFIPDYVKCVLSEVKTHTTWCGKRELGFAFQGIEHAVSNTKNKGRLLTCPDCWFEIVKVGQSGVWRP